MKGKERGATDRTTVAPSFDDEPRDTHGPEASRTHRRRRASSSDPRRDIGGYIGAIAVSPGEKKS